MKVSVNGRASHVPVQDADTPPLVTEMVNDEAVDW
jgi:hypothetical protein